MRFKRMYWMRWSLFISRDGRTIWPESHRTDGFLPQYRGLGWMEVSGWWNPCTSHKIQHIQWKLTPHSRILRMPRLWLGSLELQCICSMQILSTFFFLMDGSTVVQVVSPGKCKIADQQILCLELARPEPCEMLCHGQRLWRSRGGVWIHIDIDLSNPMKSIQGEKSVRQFFFDRPNYVHDETQMARVEHGTNLIVMSTHSTRIYQAWTPCTVVLPFRWSMGPSMSIPSAQFLSITKRNMKGQVDAWKVRACIAHTYTPHIHIYAAYA